jgi:hypothetical protein
MEISPLNVPAVMLDAGTDESIPIS